MQYYKLNAIYVEYDPFRNNFYHWNTITCIGKKDRLSDWIISKLITNILEPIHEAEFREMFERIAWLKTPSIEYITIEGSIKLSNNRQKHCER